MNVQPMPLDGVLLIEPKVFGDARGFFMEVYNAGRYDEAGLTSTFVQDNLSLSGNAILRGLHLQNPHAQDKLVYVLAGEVFDVVVDLRVGSPTFAKWTAARLSAENRHQLFVPKGFAHGFCVLSDEALFAYKCSDLYTPAAELSVRWDDPDLAIDWPIEAPRVSEKGAAAPYLKDLDQARLPCFATRA